MTLTLHPAEASDLQRGARLVADGVVAVRGSRRVLDGVSFVVAPGELVALVGPSGGGKSTLLESLAGIRAVADGSVELDGADIGDRERGRAQIGFVPQDDIIHRELRLRETLEYAARLRLPGGGHHGDLVSAVLTELDLLDQASLPVGSLSGGQRKRASIAVELLARPRMLLLDEPTAGLDPATATALIRTLRTLADGGCTVVLSTHNMQDLASSDAVIVLTKDGHVSYSGERDGAILHLGLRSRDTLSPAEIPRAHVDALPALDLDRRPASAIEQWRVLTRRNATLLTHNRLTMAIMLGAPALVVAMFAVLFTPGAFDPAHPSNQPVMVAYWLAFAGFFFGLTYGLLQIVTEVPIARRERFAGVRIGPYLASKVTVLVPILFAVDVVMLAVLSVLNRLPSMPTSTLATLAAAILLDAVVAVLLGLLISASVADASHATIALPLVCFPAVLFAGAIQAVSDMAVAGKAISVVTPARWAFESVGDVLHLGDVPAGAGTTAFDGHLATGVGALCVFAVAFTFATLATLRRRLG
jgi:ABC-type multidrug transport system ATPase subunit